jgi:hypothetical protein
MGFVIIQGLLMEGYGYDVVIDVLAIDRIK